MKVYNTQAEVEKDIVGNVLSVKGDVHFNFPKLSINASINIEADNIEADNIEAGNIEAGNIKAGNIKAGDISFYGVCWSYLSFKCKSIVGRREKSKYFCLDKEVEIIKGPEVTEMTVAEISKALGKTIKIIE